MTSGSGVSAAYRPLVAVVAYHLADDRVARWPDGGYGVPAPYIAALRRSGARTAIVSPGEIGPPEDILEPYDGLLLVGGGDVDPARYGAVPDTEHNYGVESDRDGFESDLLLTAERMRIPVLCICRGMQVMNVAYGGTLAQHLPDRPELLEHGVPLDGTETLHTVTPEPTSYLAAVTKSGDLTCSSHHHQGVERVGDRLRVSGRSPDGLVEAIELDVGHTDDPTADPWIVGVQWHPEETAEGDPAQQSLFDALVLLARLRGSRADPGGSGGRGRAYRIADPDPGWAERYEAEAARIVGSLPADLVTRIDHVGSTAVAGLAAKPIVDIQLSVSDVEDEPRYLPALTDAGYLLRVREPGHRMVRTPGLDVQVHICPAGSGWERRHLLFRDWLRQDAADRAAYEALKRDLASRDWPDMNAYADAKTALIAEIMARAEAWAGTTHWTPH